MAITIYQLHALVMHFWWLISLSGRRACASRQHSAYFGARRDARQRAADRRQDQRP